MPMIQKAVTPVCVLFFHHGYVIIRKTLWLVIVGDHPREWESNLNSDLVKRSRFLLRIKRT